MKDKRDVRLSPSALKDFKNALTWYAAEETELAERFELAVENAVDRIASHPAAYVAIYRDVRRAIVKEFPYGLFVTGGTISGLLLSFIFSGTPPSGSAARKSPRCPRLTTP